MIGNKLLSSFNFPVMLSPLVKNDVDNVVVFADILGWRGHDAVDDFAEERDIAAGVPTDPRDELGYRTFMLKKGLVKIRGRAKSIAHLRNVLEVNDQHLLLSVCNPLLWLG